MKIHGFAICAAAVGLLVTSPDTAISQESGTGFTLQVRPKYSGTGTVDDKHKIYIVLWDSPDFVKDHPAGTGSPPLAIQSTSSRDGLVTFNDVKKTPVYVSAAYDPTGQWDVQSPPPEGSSLGLYSKAPGQPQAVDLKPGKTAKAELPFDDSVKMKGGKATQQ